jgi:hypothetical protein
MTVPHIVRVGVLVLATTGFYTYVGQMVPQKEVQPPEDTTIRSDMTTDDMVKIGRAVRAKTRVPGLSDVEYLAQSMYEPSAYVVEGFPPAMPPMNQPPFGLTDQEILCVIAALQTLGGTPTVTLQTTHKYMGAAAAPGAAPAPAPPPTGAP